MDLIYTHTTGGKLYQSGYLQIPHDLNTVGIDLVIFAAEECPPLNHFKNAVFKYFPNDDTMAAAYNPEIYKKLLTAAQKAIPDILHFLQRGKNILITCNQGINRSSLVTGLALKAVGMKGWDAINLIKNRREGTLTNSAFMSMLAAE